MRGRADIFLLFVSPLTAYCTAHRISARNIFANLERPIILTRHRSTAELHTFFFFCKSSGGWVKIHKASCTQSLSGAYSRVERSSHVPSTHPAKGLSAPAMTYSSSCWFTQRLYSQLANVYWCLVLLYVVLQSRPCTTEEKGIAVI